MIYSFFQLNRQLTGELESKLAIKRPKILPVQIQPVLAAVRTRHEIGLHVARTVQAAVSILITTIRHDQAGKLIPDAWHIR